MIVPRSLVKPPKETYQPIAASKNATHSHLQLPACRRRNVTRYEQPPELDGSEHHNYHDPLTEVVIIVSSPLIFGHSMCQTPSAHARLLESHCCERPLWTHVSITRHELF